MQLSDFRLNDRVQLHPATDLWMRGARFGEVKEIGRKYVRVHLDRLGKSVLIAPNNVLEILN